MVFGIVTGSPEQPQVIPLEHPEPVTEEVFGLTAPLHPSTVFRIAAPCVGGSCKNFGNGLCHLAKIVTQRPTVTEDLPPCRIRPQCVWWHQEGRQACLRCPEFVTINSVTLAFRERAGH